MTQKEKQDLAQWVITQAKQAGAQEISLVISEGRSSEIAIREGKIDQLKENISIGLGIDLYVDNRFSSHSTNRLDPKELTPFIEEAVAATRYLAEDPYRKLPDPQLYFKGVGEDLKVFDPNFGNINPAEKIQLALSTEAEIAGHYDQIISIETNYGDSISETLMMHSNGFEGWRKTSNFSLSASVSIQGTGDSRPSDYDYDSQIFFQNLTKTGIGTHALERVMQKTTQQKIASGAFPMLVENRIASRLLAPLLDALQGSALQQNNSFLRNQLGQQVASPLLHLEDHPHLVSGSSSRYYDYEGLATQNRTIFDQGKVNTYLIDTYYANKMKVPATSSQTTNLLMQTGDRSLEEILAALHETTIFVTGFNGGNCNNSTGDFSYGIEGYLYQNGQRVAALHEMNITGNMIELWKSLIEVGNDPRRNSAWQIPSLLFETVNFSGL